jgi:hypothetical protein
LAYADGKNKTKFVPILKTQSLLMQNNKAIGMNDFLLKSDRIFQLTAGTINVEIREIEQLIPLTQLLQL